ncbi:MAG: methionyl-tRNA formyltransferase, partial [Eubacterium sp.]|nr:methionyl-tRNA formyltransferase [Eubacterium sp.]
FDRLSELGAKALLEAIELIEQGKAVKTPQPEDDFGYARMITKADSPINFSKSADEVHNKVRGLQTWPVASTIYNGKMLKVHKTIHSDNKGGRAGEVVDNNGKLIVSCGDGKCLEIIELQLEGKKRMDAKTFLIGNKIEIGYILGE